VLLHEVLQSIAASVYQVIAAITATAAAAPSGVRSEHPHPAERTRKLQVHMGLVASSTARIASNNRRVLPRPPFTAHFAA
jgi:hypothetical protein